MLKSIKNILFSTRLTAVLLVVFAAAIGVATFIENDYGTPASKALIFNTKWFELVIFLLGINLVGNIFKYKMFRKEKLAVLTFHLSFILIVLGAGITRYISFEGSMHIREGDTSSTIVSDDTYLSFKVDNKDIQYTGEEKLFLNPRYNKPFNFEFDFEGAQGNVPVSIRYKNFIPNSIDTVVEAQGGGLVIEIVTVGQGGRVSRFIESGQAKYFGSLPVAFNNTDHDEAVKILATDTGLFINSPYDIQYMSMDDQSTDVLKKDTMHLLLNRRLYTIGGVQLVYKNLHENSVIKKIEAPEENMNGEDAVVLDLVAGNETKEVTLFGGKGYVSNFTILQLGGLNFSLRYGSKEYITPFAVRLNDFKLERYPGSNSPSSFESEVTLIDNRNGGTEFDQRIFMNNVLDYDGYRLFQSSYDQDELGTILSVNHDWWGTGVTYVGYFLMMLGMVITIVSKKTRFQQLRTKIKDLRKPIAVFVIGLMSVSALNAQSHDHNHDHDHDHEGNQAQEIIVDAGHAERFSQLLVQDPGGRVKPIHTMSSEILRKVTGKLKFDDQQPEQVFLGMMYNPDWWREVKMIKVKNPQLEEELGAVDHYVSFLNLFDEQGMYRLGETVETANRKKPAEQSKYDKEVLKVDERANICLMVFRGAMLRIFPKPNDENNTWYTQMDYGEFKSHDSIFVKAMLPLYFTTFKAAHDNNDWSLPDSTLMHMEKFQRKFGGEVIPSQGKIDAEIRYNKMQLFKRLFMYYAMVGLLMLFFLFADIISPRKWKRVAVKVSTVLLIGLFLLHAGGLAMRWYISGHAPWSNGYESMIYIAFVTILAGFVFSKSSKMTIAATAVLSSLILMVAHLNFMDPEITPLVPVLKSYWLMIHVAIITGSYGFLGLGALLGLMCLILMIVTTTKNKDRIVNTIKELTFINELTLTVGLFMAATGTFLGGVWANESWGRYWGWDPKETWALVIVLFYAMLLHLRFIPKANGKYLFNVLALFGFSTVIMTYFGVNYYLSGLHSYAKGDPVPIPDFVPITVGVLGCIAILAYFRNKKMASK